MQRFTYVVFINLARSLRERDRVSRARGQLLCTNVVPRPMSVVLNLGTRLRVRMRTELENGVLHNGQQPQSVVNGFY